MNDETIRNDYQLDAYAKECALDILADTQDRDEAFDRAHESADGSQYVIYYWRAHAICAGCNTDQGEAFLEDVGNPEPCTYDDLATIIAYGELRARIVQQIDAQLDEIEGEA